MAVYMIEANGMVSRVDSNNNTLSTVQKKIAHKRAKHTQLTSIDRMIRQAYRSKEVVK